jgi:hypothetical protein
MIDSPYCCVVILNGKLPPSMAASLTARLAELAGKKIFISISEIPDDDKEILEFINKKKGA